MHAPRRENSGCAYALALIFCDLQCRILSTPAPATSFQAELAQSPLSDSIWQIRSNAVIDHVDVSSLSWGWPLGLTSTSYINPLLLLLLLLLLMTWPRVHCQNGWECGACWSIVISRKPTNIPKSKTRKLLVRVSRLRIKLIRYTHRLHLTGCNGVTRGGADRPGWHPLGGGDTRMK